VTSGKACSARVTDPLRCGLSEQLLLYNRVIRQGVHNTENLVLLCLLVFSRLRLRRTCYGAGNRFGVCFLSIAVWRPQSGRKKTVVRVGNHDYPNPWESIPRANHDGRCPSEPCGEPGLAMATTVRCLYKKSCDFFERGSRETVPSKKRTGPRRPWKVLQSDVQILESCLLLAPERCWHQKEERFLPVAVRLRRPLSGGVLGPYSRLCRCSAAR
jgi:hypothetical protein